MFSHFPVSPSLPDIPFLSLSNLFSVTCHINSFISCSFPPPCPRSVPLLAGHSLRYLIIENFIPPEEKNKIMNRLYFDGDEDQWKFQPLVPTGGYVPDPRSAPALPTHGHGMSPGGGAQQGPQGTYSCLRVEILSKPSPTGKGHPSLTVHNLHSSLFGCVFSRNLCSVINVPLNFCF